MPQIAMLVTNPFRPDPRVHKEALSLRQAGYRISVVAWDRAGQFAPQEEIEGIEIRRIRVRSRYSAGSRQIFYLPQFWLQALKELEQIRPQIVHCHDLDTTPPGSWYAGRKRIPWIFDAHECYPEQIRPQISPLLYPLLIWLERRMARKSTHLLTVGNLLAQRFRAFGARVTIIGNYPRLEHFQAAQNRLTRQQIGIAPDAFVVAYIGGFTRERAILPLLEATQKVKGVIVLLAGDGPQRADIEAALPTYPQVRYLGWIPQEQVPAHTALADVIYYGLKTAEGNSQYSTPNTLFNAMAAGKPVLTTQAGEIAQIVHQEACGVIIERAEADLIAQAIQSLRSAALRSQMSENARRAAQERYNWDAAGQTLCQLYASLLKT